MKISLYQYKTCIWNYTSPFCYLFISENSRRLDDINTKIKTTKISKKCFLIFRFSWKWDHEKLKVHPISWITINSNPVLSQVVYLLNGNMSSRYDNNRFYQIWSYKLSFYRWVAINFHKFCQKHVLFASDLTWNIGFW